MLRELVIDEKVIVIDDGGSDRAPVGTMLTCTRLPLSRTSGMGFKSKEHKDISICKIRVLAIGDKVVRGPDWDWGRQDGGEGNVGVVVRFHQGSGLHPVEVKWGNGMVRCYRINPDHQDLKPTGDSEPVRTDEPDGKAIKFHAAEVPREIYHAHSHALDAMKYVMAGTDFCTATIQSKEDSMTREQQAKHIDRDVKTAEEAILEHKEKIAQEDEKIVDLKKRAADLRKFKNDKEATAHYIIVAKNLDPSGEYTAEQQAKAIMYLAGIGITV